VISRRKLDQLLDQLEPNLARAFRESVDGIRSRANVSALVAALEARDIDAAARAAGITQASWTAVTESARRAYIEGGAIAAADAPARLGFAFDMNNPRAQEWLADHSSAFVTRINSDQRAAIQTALTAGFEQGRNPRSTALDIVGRVNRATGRRGGGIVGLTNQMSGFVTNARAELADPETMANYLTRARRDKRFDRLVQRSIDEGKPLSQTDIDRIVGRYSDRLLNLRGDNIARTETLGSLNEGMDEALRQAVDEGLVSAGNVRRVWDATGDDRTREDHIAANGQEVGLDEPFIVGGAAMMHPGDFSAPVEQVINCRCVTRQVVDWIGNEL
jgi:hypothetical protein